MKKKLIEVALPLEAINKEAAREKSIRHGHPSTLHLWWARRPLAACRAIIFASLVDDPSSHPDKFPTAIAQEAERQRLFRMIEELVKWENINNKKLFKQAHEEILKSTDGNPPAIYDPFCGGGSIPLEAQRLGLKAYASDLNPVAVLITKAMVEIPPRFSGKPPVNPAPPRQIETQPIWRDAAGLAADIRYYGTWLRDEAERRIGYLYPKVKVLNELGKGEATVIAWLWARTVKCPNPACGGNAPLVKSFEISTRKGNRAWVEPIINSETKKIKFVVKMGDGTAPVSPKLARGAKFRCLLCANVIDEGHIKAEGMAGKLAAQMLAIVAEGPKGRIYLSPDDSAISAAQVAKPEGILSEEIGKDPRNIWCAKYGLTHFRDLFTPRQLRLLEVLSDLLTDVRAKVLEAASSKFGSDHSPISSGGKGASAYADAITVYLAFAIDRLADKSSSLAWWMATAEKMAPTYARQSLPMVWDFAEMNPFCTVTSNLAASIEWVSKVVEALPASNSEGEVMQRDARSSIRARTPTVVITDPPYYDNISYADLSDFFYVWLRRGLKNVFPELFSTVLVPKAAELIASPYRFSGGKSEASKFFQKGIGELFSWVGEYSDTSYPFCLFYAFKQQEQVEEEDTPSDAGTMQTVSTGWETMLDGLIESGIVIEGTLPIRTERGGGLRNLNQNALASSIVLVCRRRDPNSRSITRGAFVASLKSDLGIALKALKTAGIAPTDLAQSAIGPGMAAFSRPSRVLEANGSSMSVRTALGLINQTLDEITSSTEGELDRESRWAVAWFETHGFSDGAFGEAETLATAKAISVAGLQEAGVIVAKSGKVRLLPIDSLDSDWDPKTDNRLTVWELTHHLIQQLEEKGEDGAALLIAKADGLAELARDLAYRLYGICERKNWARDAQRYNALVVAWSAVVERARSLGHKPISKSAQISML